MSQTIYRNGEYVPEEKAAISPFDRGLLYGDGLFETLRCYDGKFFRLDRHIERLRSGLKRLEIPLALEAADFATVLRELVKQNNVASGIARIVVTRGVAEFGLLGKHAQDPMVLVTCWAQPAPDAKRYETGIHCIVANERLSATQGLKSLNYIVQILARREANVVNADDAILLDSHGHVAEGSAGNLFIVRDRELITPSLQTEILAGITRATVLEMAHAEKLPVVERVVHQNDLFHAEEVFLTSSVAEILPVTRIGSHWVHLGQPGPVTREMMRAYRAFVQRDAK
ncbi:MAG: aminotransferase class IV [Verrucomicrobiia bacterium]|jgi:branched-chain amino acid aminotransferase